MTDKLTRIAIVSADKCKPKKCRQECKKSCPVVRMGMRLLIFGSYSVASNSNIQNIGENVPRQATLLIVHKRKKKVGEREYFALVKQT